LPEGHTLHRIAADLRRRFAGRPVASTSPQGRFDAGAAQVDGRVLTATDAWGKHVLVIFEGLDDVVHVHLGLFGGWAFSDAPDADPPVVGQVRWRLRGPGGLADLRGPTACELLNPPQVDALLARLGPDPLRADADQARSWQRISRSRAPIATLLMDQSVVAGVGNVYRAEVLFRHQVPPGRAGRDIGPATWDALWTDLVTLMREGVRTGTIDTVRPEHDPEAMGRPPRDDDHGGEVYVYRRTGQPCLVCGTPVLTEVVGARNLFWCPSCQSADRLTP
jgi:formamidopyrimidine-DNA glycosylase